ncbi:MAG: aminotransferase class III-fold pyridoxal phosphate-dependent enzyme [Anaerolinea sp.]|nr:aminotransferase class III-fold pyridoxal phosphate-dependent enzyme [Anaerolinea sp.]
MSSSRLPGKVLADIRGKPMILRVVERARGARTLDEVVLATTVDPADDPLAALGEQIGIPVFRGDQADVLDRYYQAARHFNADVVVRLTGDCPLLDPQVIDRVVTAFSAEPRDYVSNTLIVSYPDGLDTEVFSFAALERAWREAGLASEREHVTPYIHKNPALFRLGNVLNERDLSHMRWTVDEPSDLEFVRAIYARLNAQFTMDDVLRLIELQPDLTQVNAGFERNEGYAKSLREDKLVKEASINHSPKGTSLYTRAKKRIPGGTQLLSKRPEMFLPDNWPSYYKRARGVEVWDIDDNHYIDMSHFSVGACVLGYADPDVNAAVHAVVDAGSMSVLNCPEDVELADLLCELHPWADMVRYTRAGGESMTVAVRIARAVTGRDKIAFCGYHGWHDWYLAANLGSDKALDGHLLPGLSPAGVPRGLVGTSLPFRYNHLEELQAIVDDNPGEIAAIVMEPIRGDEPEPGFLEGVRALADKIGAVYIIDEITAGFRLNNGGAHLLYGVQPDIAVFAKAISNGYPMGAVIGRGAVMQAAQQTFISSTQWTERIGPAAALATLRKYIANDVSAHLIHAGKLVQEGWQNAAVEAKLNIHVGGIIPLSHFSFEYPNGNALKTLFTQMMLDRGYLAATGFYASYAHSDEQIARYLDTVYEVFALIAQALANESVEQQLRGPLAHTGFRRLVD